MEEMAFAQIVGAWVSIFLTLAVLSFLFDDTPTTFTRFVVNFLKPMLDA